MSEPLREDIARIIDPGTWHDRDVYVNIMTKNGGCHPDTIAGIADRRVRDSLATADQIIALLAERNTARALLDRSGS